MKLTRLLGQNILWIVYYVECSKIKTCFHLQQSNEPVQYYLCLRQSEAATTCWTTAARKNVSPLMISQIHAGNGKSKGSWLVRLVAYCGGSSWLVFIVTQQNGHMSKGLQNRKKSRAVQTSQLPCFLWCCFIHILPNEKVRKSWACPGQG